MYNGGEKNFFCGFCEIEITTMDAQKALNHVNSDAHFEVRAQVRAKYQKPAKKSTKS